MLARKRQFLDYFSGIWNARYFWFHLACSDLRSRWRRSCLGFLWVVIQPLGLTILISFVFGKIFNSPIKEYAPYIFSGVILWEFIVSCTVGGSLSFVQADAYIKQFRHPLAIYTLRNAIGNLIIFLVASLGLFLWVILAFPQNVNLSWISLPLVPIFLLFLGWPLATCLAFIATKFRDLPHALGLILQAVWFVSPIYFEEKVFQRGLSFLIDYNPIYHILQLVRAPFLYGDFPTLVNYSYVMLTIGFFSLVAIYLGYRNENKIIYYL